MFDDGAAVTVVCASRGVPAARPAPATRSRAWTRPSSLEGVTVFCAGVGEGPDGALVTAGGRVLSVTGQGPTLAEARRRAYDGVALLRWPGLHHRTDIAAAAVVADSQEGTT